MFLLDVVEQVTSPLVFVITISTSPKVSSHHSLAENHLVAAEFVLDKRARDQKDLGLLDHCIIKEGGWVIKIGCFALDTLDFFCKNVFHFRFWDLSFKYRGKIF